MRKKYYSVRSGIAPNATVEIDTLRKFLWNLFRTFSAKEYFQEYLGYECVDAGVVGGKLGHDIALVVQNKIRKFELWPIWGKYERYTEDDVFDMIEFLFDVVSKPLEGRYHSYSECGWHYETFDQSAGQAEFRDEVNAILCDYSVGFDLSADGEILTVADAGMEPLLELGLSTLDQKAVQDRVAYAIRKFRRHRSSIDERREAVRNLADVLEFLRPQIKTHLLKKDEAALFQIANEFGIRHHGGNQKRDYDESIWLNWMFYFYISTIGALERMIRKADKIEGIDER